LSRKRRKHRARRTRSTGAKANPKPAAAVTDDSARPRPAPRGRGGEERPPAPWGSFPLVELVVLVALVMLVAGFLTAGERGTVLLATGLVLGSLAGLELSVREHFAGYRSHTLLLAGAEGVGLALGLFYLADLPAAVALAAGVVASATGAWFLVRAFRARSGRGFKLR
jgi:hypothetical protein